VISRSAGNLDRAFAGLEVEKVAANALDGSAMREAVAGSGIVLDCVGLPADRMADHPKTARVIVDAAGEAGARCLHVSSFWSFLPVQRLPIDESHPRTGGNSYIEARREAEDVFLASGGAVVHLPDFFGPLVHTSTLQNPLVEAAAGKKMSWIGGADTERESIYVPDAMRMVADLAMRDDAYGQGWVFPGSGPLSANRTAEIVGEHLGRTVEVRSAPPWLLRILGLFSSDLRAFLPMVPHYVRPISYDPSKLRGLLGEFAITRYEEAIPATLNWIAAGGS
jgi:nucleoside-diphosphate-sugar epimerase